MLLSAVVDLGGGGHDVEGARAVHAWFLKQISLVDAGLAGQLHDAPGLKPFTTALRFGPGERAYLRLTCLTWELSAALLSALTARPETLTLGKAEYRLGAVHTRSGSHLWASHDRYERLVRHWQEARPASRLRLEFATPTTFHSRGLNLPLPLPRLLVESWLRRWNAFSPLPLGEELIAFAEETLAVSRYSLHSERAGTGQAATEGFTGTCELRATREDVDKLRQLHLLAAYSLYCGSGHHTTMGLGQTRVEE